MDIVLSMESARKARCKGESAWEFALAILGVPEYDGLIVRKPGDGVHVTAGWRLVYRLASYLPIRAQGDLALLQDLQSPPPYASQTKRETDVALFQRLLAALNS